MRKNPDLLVSVVFAAATGCFVPFSLDRLFGSINIPLLLLLFCLMSIVAGMRESGLFLLLYRRLFSGTVSSRRLGRFFIFSCFFSSMLITNDVSLIVFVPLAIEVMTAVRCVRNMIPVVVWQTVAANLGSMLTPVGNPQNLFIYAHYGMGLVDFLAAVAPVTAMGGFAIYLATCMLDDRKVALPAADQATLPRKRVLILLCLFAVCIADVLRIVPFWLMALIVVPIISCMRPRLFCAVDYKLLMLFLFLFIGVGNLTRMPEVSRMATELLMGHEFIVPLVLCQFISNVPAAVMLAPYTNEAADLLLGVNIGGLGTIIASMASVISLKAYSGARHSIPAAYLRSFTAANLGLLFILLLFYEIVLVH